MSRDPKKDHKANPLGVPVLREDSPEDAPTPAPLPELWGVDGRERVDVTIGFSTTNKVISRIIRWLTRGTVSHAWIAYNDMTLGLRMVMQAEAWGFEVRPWQRWTRENRWVGEFRLLGGEQIVALQNRARDLGAKYDWVAGLWVGVSSWFKRWLRSGLSFRPSRTPKRLMCSEAVVRFLREADCGCVKELDEELTSPAELYDIVRSSSEFVPMRYVARRRSRD